MSNPISDMEKADVFFCIGTNMTECHPVAATRMKKALARGSKLIVADPRYIRLAEMADLYLPLRVGTDVALLLGMAHVIVRENLIDHKFVSERTNGVEEYIEHVKKFTPEWASEITGVPASDIEKAAIMYAAADKASIYYTLGITEHICGVDNVQSLSNLALITGHLGREGCGINPLRGQNNIQGAGDAGAAPSEYPGYQTVDKPANKEKFEKLYGREMDSERGITKVTALEMCGNGIHAMLIDGENTAVSDPIASTANTLYKLWIISLSSTSSSPKLRQWQMSYSLQLHGEKQMAHSPTQNAAFNACAPQSPLPVKRNPIGGS